MRLALENLRKEYKKKTALVNFSATLTPGVYGLLGPNGAGKTTLIRIIADVLRPTAGKVYLNGVVKEELGEAYRDLLGYLPQELGLYPHYTGRRFLYYIAALKGIDRGLAQSRVEGLARLTNLTDHLETKIGRYSGGMKRRLGIAQSLLNDPKILILDEPTAGLDPMERIRFRNMISEISKDRIVLLSTHIVSDADLIAKEIIFLKDGQIVQQGSIPQIQARMEGRVWLAQVPPGDLPRLSGEYVITNILQQEGGAQVRIVHEGRPFEGSTPTQPLLEDAYLHIFEYLRRA